MQIKLSTTEVKEAVIQWLKQTQGLDVTPDQLQEHRRTEGEYDTRESYFDGFALEVDNLHNLKRD